MAKFALFTDSCCDLPAALAEQYDITALPLGVIIGEESFANYLDGRELTSQALYARIREGAMPSTNAVSVGNYEEAMRERLQAGDDILCINFSGVLSTTYQSAVIAATELRDEFPERIIEVIDSCDVSLGQGLLLLLCAQEQQKGATLEQVRDFALEKRLYIDHWFTVDDLNHLKRGGRISATSAVVGSMLAVKPILTINAEGKLEAVGKERGRKAAINTLVKKAVTLWENPKESLIMIGHADCEEEAFVIANQLKEKLGVSDDNIVVHCIGAVIGSHVGPGTMAVFFEGKASR
ncbi:DegV family protein [Bengtsoniella intestinalis]|uniref:DegV family protein n=1 Tax=Bengtsoniella intestinalis TaxID=3073143 RepID=UPI00391EF87A